jgi:WD40 repeat protein
MRLLAAFACAVLVCLGVEARRSATPRVTSTSQSALIALIAAALMTLFVQAEAAGSPKPQVTANVASFGLVSEGATFSDDGRAVLTGETRGFARLWDAASGRLIRVFSPKEEGYRKASRVFGHSSKADIVVAGDMGDWTGVWRASTGELLYTLDDQNFSVVAFRPGDKQMLSADRSADTIRIWDTASWKVVRKLATGAKASGDLNTMAFSPTGDVIFSPDGKYALVLRKTLLDLGSGRAIWSLDQAPSAAAF